MGTQKIKALMANLNLRDVLLAKGSKVHYQVFNGGHEYISIAAGTSALLR